MTGKEYCAAIDKLGLTPEASCEFFEVHRTTEARWVNGNVPAAVAICLKIMITGGISVEQANKWLGRKARF